MHRKGPVLGDLQYRVLGAGEMAQRWQALAAFVEEPGLISSTHTVALSHLYLLIQAI